MLILTLSIKQCITISEPALNLCRPLLLPRRQPLNLIHTMPILIRVHITLPANLSRRNTPRATVGIIDIRRSSVGRRTDPCRAVAAFCGRWGGDGRGEGFGAGGLRDWWWEWGALGSWRPGLRSRRWRVVGEGRDGRSRKQVRIAGLAVRWWVSVLPCCGRTAGCRRPGAGSC